MYDPWESTSHQRGVVSVWVILLVFGVMGLLALIVDLGGARLAQLQMQSAVDAAADEPLRRSGPEGPRRTAVRDLVAWNFDDDFDLSADARSFGAGTVPDLGDGFGDANASQLIRGVGVYDPDLQLNLSDLPFGDMVRGDYRPAEPPREASDYTRPDFVNSSSGEAFLLRMRRTRNELGLDDNLDVSSGGPPIPFVFALGGLLAGGDPDAGYSPRHDGLTVRATAIADAAVRDGGATRVKFAGLPVPSAGLAGRTAWTLRRSAWDALPVGSAVVMVEQASGVLQQNGVTVGVTAPLADRLGAVVSASPPVVTVDAGYVPITELIGGTERVIGFGVGSRSFIQSDATTRTFEITRLPDGVATGNATARVDAEGARLLGILGSTSPADLLALQNAHRQFQGALRAPLLVR